MILASLLGCFHAYLPMIPTFWINQIQIQLKHLLHFLYFFYFLKYTTHIIGLEIYLVKYISKQSITSTLYPNFVLNKKITNMVIPFNWKKNKVLNVFEKKRVKLLKRNSRHIEVVWYRFAF